MSLQPYPAYKDSGIPWLGHVPAHWSQLPGRACYQEKKVPNTGMQETTVLSLSYGQIVVKPVEKLHGLVPASFETYQIVDPGDIIVRPTDLQNDWNSLRFGLSRHCGIITSAYMCLHTDDVMTREYGHFLLHTYDLKKVFYGLGSGLRQNLDWGDFKYLRCVVPPLAEQAAIVRYLGHIDRRIRRYIRAKQKLVRLLEEQKQAIIHRAVTRGLDPSVRLKPSGLDWLGDIPAHWEIGQLRRLVSTVTSGSRGWAEFYSDEGDIFLQSGNLGRSMALNLSYIQYVTPPPTSEGVRTKVQRNDILICITGALTGNVVLVDVELPIAYVNQHVALVRPIITEVSPRYLAYCLHSKIGQGQFKTTEYGGTKQGLGLEDVRSVVVPLPPRKEQEVLVSILDQQLASLNAAVQCTHREIALLREYRTRLTADVVTGKLDVRVAAASLPDEADDDLAAVAGLADEAEVLDDAEGGEASGLDGRDEEIAV